MKMPARVSLPLALALMLANFPAYADAGRDFVTAFAAAVNGRNRSDWEKFMSPGSRACLNGPGRKMLDQIFASDTRDRIPPDSKVGVTPIGKHDTLIGQGMLAYPDRPTHYFQIDIGPPGRATRSLIRYGRLQHGRWQYVIGCPTSEGLAQAQAKAMERERVIADAAARERLKTLPQNVIAEARRLIAEGRRIEAARMLARRTGADLSTAFGLVRVLDGDAESQ
jgi:hypothetical protein